MMSSLCLRCVLLLVIAFTSNAVVAQQTITIPSTVKANNFTNVGRVIITEVISVQWTGTQDITLSWTFTNGTAIGGSVCADDNSVDFINTSDSNTAIPNANIVIRFTICANALDAPDKTFTATVTADQEVFDENASNCRSTNVCTITYTIENVVPTTVTIDGSSVTLDEGDTLDIPLTLSRRLIAGERIDVPFTILGVNISDADYQLKLKSGANLNRGVTFDSTKLSFGQGAKVATLQFRAIHDDILDETNESAAIIFDTPVDVNNVFRFEISFSSSSSNKIITITNNPNKPVIIRIRSKIFLEGPLR